MAMILCNVSRHFLKQGYPRLSNGVQMFCQDILEPYYHDDVQRGLRSGAMSQQTIPVYITETSQLHPPSKAAVNSSPVQLHSVRAGSALTMDSQGNAVSSKTTPSLGSAAGDSINKSNSAGIAAEEPLRRQNKNPRRNRLISKILRADLASEAAAVRMFAVQSKAGGQRPDLQYFQETEKELLEQLKQMAVQYRTRPSLMSPLVSASGAALGAFSAVLPRGLSDAVKGGVADALNEQYNDQLRELRASGAADTEAAAPLREALRALRDQPRCAGSVKVPGLAELQRPKDLTLEEGVAGLVKLGFSGLMSLSARL